MPMHRHRRARPVRGFTPAFAVGGEWGACPTSRGAPAAYLRGNPKLVMTWHDSLGLARLVIVAPMAYVALILILRIAGKRMLSKMNAFDLVVTVALGSVLSTVLLSKDIAVTEGLAAMALLIGLQFVVAWTTTRFHVMRRVVKSEPRMLFFRGRFLREAMRRENVPEDAIIAGIRQQGFTQLSEVEAVVLEADGSLSIVCASEDSAARDTLDDVARE